MVNHDLNEKIKSRRIKLKEASQKLKGALGTDFGLGKLLGVNNFPEGYNGLHEWFYNVLLTGTNSVPIQSLWLVYFTNIPIGGPSVIPDVKQFENKGWM